MYFFKTPALVRSLFPGLLWRFKTTEKVVYLTFDDGPVPEATPWVLEQLAAYNAKATFFMVGENIKRYPDLYKRVLAEGHRVGNHTYNHLKGWETTTAAYLENYHLTEGIMNNPEETLFRPPHGQLKLSQMRQLQPLTKIIMWDVLSGDFDKQITPEKCLQKAIRNTRPGSIIVFHDSIKTIKLLKEVLPAYLEHYSALGYKFAAL